MSGKEEASSNISPLLLEILLLHSVQHTLKPPTKTMGDRALPPNISSCKIRSYSKFDALGGAYHLLTFAGGGYRVIFRSVWIANTRHVHIELLD